MKGACKHKPADSCAYKAQSELPLSFIAIYKKKIKEKVGMAAEKRTKTRVVVMENHLYTETSLHHVYEVK